MSASTPSSVSPETAAASIAHRRTRVEAQDSTTLTAFELRAIVAGPAMPMSPEQLDAALAAAFPGDETPGYL